MIPCCAPASRRGARCEHLDTTPLRSTNHRRERGGSAIAPLEGVQSGVAVVIWCEAASSCALARSRARRFLLAFSAFSFSCANCAARETSSSVGCWSKRSGPGPSAGGAFLSARGVDAAACASPAAHHDGVADWRSSARQFATRLGCTASGTTFARSPCSKRPFATTSPRSTRVSKNGVARRVPLCLTWRPTAYGLAGRPVSLFDGLFQAMPAATSLGREQRDRGPAGRSVASAPDHRMRPSALPSRA